jgi:hypothetical protein
MFGLQKKIGMKCCSCLVGLLNLIRREEKPVISSVTEFNKVRAFTDTDLSLRTSPYPFSFTKYCIR